MNCFLTIGRKYGVYIFSICYFLSILFNLFNLSILVNPYLGRTEEVLKLLFITCFPSCLLPTVIQ